MVYCLPPNLKFLRQKHDHNQAHLAELMNVGNTTISSWESDRSRPDIEEVIKLAGIYKISIDDLLLTNLTNEKIANVVNEPATSYEAKYNRAIKLEMLGFLEEMKNKIADIEEKIK